MENHWNSVPLPCLIPVGMFAYHWSGHDHDLRTVKGLMCGICWRGGCRGCLCLYNFIRLFSSSNVFALLIYKQNVRECNEEALGIIIPVQLLQVEIEQGGHHQPLIQCWNMLKHMNRWCLVDTIMSSFPTSLISVNFGNIGSRWVSECLAVMSEAMLGLPDDLCNLRHPFLPRLSQS